MAFFSKGCKPLETTPKSVVRRVSGELENNKKIARIWSNRLDQT